MTYTLEAVELVGTVVGSNKPATWWTLLPPTEANQAAQLALLSRVPTAVSKALQRFEEQIETVRDRWGTVCCARGPAGIGAVDVPVRAAGPIGFGLGRGR